MKGYYCTWSSYKIKVNYGYEKKLGSHGNLELDSIARDTPYFTDWQSRADIESIYIRIEVVGVLDRGAGLTNAK